MLHTRDQQIKLSKIDQLKKNRKNGATLSHCKGNLGCPMYIKYTK